MTYVEKLEIAIHKAMELYPMDIEKRKEFVDNELKESD